MDNGHVQNDDIELVARTIDRCLELCNEYQAGLDELEDRLSLVQEKMAAFGGGATARLTKIQQRLEQVAISSAEKLQHLIQTVDSAAAKTSGIVLNIAPQTDALAHTLGELEIAMATKHELAVNECMTLDAEVTAANSTLDDHMERVHHNAEATFIIIEAELINQATAHVDKVKTEVEHFGTLVETSLSQLHEFVEGEHGHSISATLAQTRFGLDALVIRLKANLGTTESAFSSMHMNELTAFLGEVQHSYVDVSRAATALIRTVDGLAKTVSGVTEAVSQTQTGLQLAVSTLARTEKLLASVSSPD